MVNQNTFSLSHINIKIHKAYLKQFETGITEPVTETCVVELLQS